MLVVKLVILRKQRFNFIDKSIEKRRLVVDIVLENFQDGPIIEILVVEKIEKIIKNLG